VNKMKNNNLYILGDSFADRCTHITETRPHIRSMHDYLEDQGNFDTITNTGKSGTSLWSQYKQFKEKYAGQSYVIMMDTAIHRFSFTDHRTEWYHHDFHSLSQVEYLLKHKHKNMTIEQRETMRALVSYFKYVQRDDYDLEMSKLMISEIRSDVERAGAKLLIIPVLHESATYDPNVNYELNYVYTKENEFFEAQGVNITKLQDLRANHMINENCEILARQVTNILKGDQQMIDYTQFVSPVETDIKKYFQESIVYDD
jgi:hypothetical protein